ncbi:glycosyltransferase [Sulfurisphaera ohwakuensis]|uniref:Glycosyltransferase n=1 Tax=Sulfurisphaera ohwakuensis TaxID=69656 RepID=A0A650CII7_SULOH|nr:glycosyltransferase [Sulfurisphaera ohwakuensis]MBB5255258.1 glycosyltransferase involved in cell wall biosynthesis [Sulfurisphaera ohwakuensis]QGR17630.1 glycosyltransferase [Sulfurisphaera ohwakuensis]
MIICVYSTAFNNVSSVDTSVMSFWRSNYHIIIADNYSTDGSWEKLQELRKEYNLTLLRLKSSRAKGRAYILEHCPENLITAYFDLDTDYNENFNKVLDYASLDKIYACFSLSTLLSNFKKRE